MSWVDILFGIPFLLLVWGGALFLCIVMYQSVKELLQ